MKVIRSHLQMSLFPFHHLLSPELIAVKGVSRRQGHQAIPSTAGRQSHSGPLEVLQLIIKAGGWHKPPNSALGRLRQERELKVSLDYTMSPI